MNDIRVTADAVEIGELYDNGDFYVKLDVGKEDINTEQKVIAWIYHLSNKAWIDVDDVRLFIEACARMNPQLDIYSK
jgi:hypothetical protein